MKNHSLFTRLILLLILASGLGLRLFDLTDQPIDFHPTRQLRGAIIARGMYYEMMPDADPAQRQRAIAFWQSTGQYEPPILERLTAITYLATGGETIWIARFYNIILWIVAGVYLYFLARRMSLSSSRDEPDQQGEKLASASGLVALAYFLILPFAVQASRTFQPDPGMVMWLVLYLYALYRWSETRELNDALASGIFAGMAVLTKAVVAFPVAAVAVALVIYTHRKKLFPNLLLDKQVWLMSALMILPTLVYYLARGERASEYFSSWTLALSHLLLQPTFYLRWLNLVQNLLSWLALVATAVSLLVARPRERVLLIALWVGYVLYGLFLPYQMYTHSYYHLMLVPIVALSIVPVSRAVLERFAFKANKTQQALLLVAAVGWMGINMWAALQPAISQDYRNEPAYWQEISSYLPADGKIIALTQDYGYRLMYYGWRKVVLWPNRGEQNLNELRGSQKEFQSYFEKRTQGISYFLVTAFRQFDDQPDLKEWLQKHYSILAESPGYLIYDLTQPPQTNSPDS